MPQGEQRQSAETITETERESPYPHTHTICANTIRTRACAAVSSSQSGRTGRFPRPFVRASLLPGFVHSKWSKFLFTMRLQLLHKLDNAHEDSIWSVAFVPGAFPALLATGAVDETVQVRCRDTRSVGRFRPTRGYARTYVRTRTHSCFALYAHAGLEGRGRGRVDGRDVCVSDAGAYDDVGELGRGIAGDG